MIKTANYRLILGSDANVYCDIKGHVTKEGQLLPATIVSSVGFKNAQLINSIPSFLVAQGKELNVAYLQTYAEENGFLLFQEGAEQTGPILISQSFNYPTNTIVTLTFADYIDKTGDGTALKAAITIATDGSTYAALAGADAVTDIDGSGKTLVITFDSALTTATNLIKIAAGALESPSENVNLEEITAVINVTVPTAVFDPANSDTDVAIDVVPTITFSQAVQTSAGVEITDDNVADLITLTETDVDGTDIAFTATIDAAKKVITVTPDVDLDNNQAYYLAVAVVESVAAGNDSVASNATFTTIAL